MDNNMVLRRCVTAMDYKIIVDSASNRTEKDFTESDIGFDVAPLAVRIGEKDYPDVYSQDVSSFLQEVTSTKEKVKTNCPSPMDFLSKRKESVHYILITLTSRLSGSFNSARLAKEQSENPDNVLVVDSGLVAGAEELLVKEAVSAIHKGLSFDQVKESVEAKKSDLEFIFGLSSLDALANSGRFPKPIALLVRKLNRKLIGTANDGKISIKQKKHNRDGLLQGIINQRKKIGKSLTGKDRIISYTGNKQDALNLKDRVKKEYPDVGNILVRENRLLCTFYASKNGLLVSY